MKSLSRLLAVAIVATLFCVSSPAEAQEPSVDKNKPKVASKQEVASPHSFVVRMRNKKYLEGSPVEFAFIDLYVLDTKVTVPIDRINGVLVAAQPDELSTLALSDGQLLTGQLDLPELKLMVEWGDATIKRDMVRSMVRSDDLVWQEQSTPNGKKWFLNSRATATSQQQQQNTGSTFTGR